MMWRGPHEVQVSTAEQVKEYSNDLQCYEPQHHSALSEDLTRNINLESHRLHEVVSKRAN